MGRYVFRLPDIGEGIAEAEVVAWHVKIGDTVAEDAPLADMMTDKATVEMESPVSGIVRELAGEVGDSIPIGSTLVVIETEGEEGEEAEEAAPAPETASPAPAPPPPAAEVASAPKEAPAAAATVARPAPAASSGKVLASPAVRARASALGVDLSTIPVGGDGVIHHEQLDAFLVRNAAPAAPAPATAPESRPVEQLSGAGEQIKVIGLRRRIADNMSASKRHIPHFTYVDECDVTELEALRVRFNGMREPGAGKLTLLPFLITAICRCIPEFPMINARYDDEARVVTRYDSVHMGMATQTPAGLMVPVIRDAQALNLGQLASEIVRLSAAARDGSAKSEELSGSTLTVTSLGPLGGIATSPVINRPEVAIIGPNRIIERPVFVSDGAGGERIEKRKLMNLSISCDHRVVDGWDAANFVQAVKRKIETPLAMLAS